MRAVIGRSVSVAFGDVSIAKAGSPDYLREMAVLDWISVIASIATSVGVLLAWRQLRLARVQATTQFEDGMTNQYRSLVATLPVKAMLGEELSGDELDENLSAFFCYFDLSNEQVFLRQQGRVSDETWPNWAEGITSNMALAGFTQAWERVRGKPVRRFDELAELLHHGSGFDPRGRSMGTSQASAGRQIPTRTPEAKDRR